MYRKISKKSWIAVLVACSMIMALCACGKKADSDLQENASEQVNVKVEENVDSVDESKENAADEDAAKNGVSKEDAANDDVAKDDAAKDDSAKEQEVAGPEEIYTPVIDGYYADIVSEFPIDNYFPMTLGTFETTIGSTSETALKNVGYALKDINDDGTQELLIMEVSVCDEKSCYGQRIMAIYTIVDDEARFVAGGWARNRYYILEDNRIYNEGSSGADDSSFEVYRLMENTDILEQLDSRNSKSDDYDRQYEEMEELIETIEVKTFADYETSENYPESAKIFWSAVYVNPAELTFATIGSDSFSAVTSDYSMDVVFFTPSEVSDFKFNALTPVNLNAEEVSFTEEELYSLDSLVMDKAVKITMEFVGDIPGYGISYKDAGGNVKRYAICQSGYDGSIYLSEFHTEQ